MAQTFFPKGGHTRRIDASHRHGDGAEYVIGRGTEIWGDGDAVEVVKVQMSYEGKVAGRKSPSFPILDVSLSGTTYRHCPDFDEIVAAVEEVVRPIRRWLITWDRPPRYNGDVTDAVLAAVKAVYTLQDEDFEKHIKQVRIVEIEAADTAAGVCAAITAEVKKQKLAPKGTKIKVARLAEEASEAV